MKKLLFLFLFLSFLGTSYAANPFFAGKKNESVNKVESYTKSRPFLFLMRLQRDMNQKIAVASRELSKNWWGLLPLIFLVFAYGVVHALGPGHGKVFSVFYFMSAKVSLARGILLSMMVGFLHGLMGIILVLSLKYILQIYSYLLQQNVAEVIQKVSYLLISLLGLYFFLKKILWRKNNSLETVNEKSGFALALSVSIVPCPGVVMIMLFCISIGALPLGLILSGVMSLGMGVTIACVGFAALFLKQFSLGWMEKKAISRARLWIEYLFSLLLFFYGFLLFIGSF